MYVPAHFSMTPDQVRELLSGVAAADLVTAHRHGLVATFLPFAFDPDAGEHGALIAHVARNNRQWCDPVTGDALVIVHGAEHYVSPRWLPSLARTGQGVPTWNYLTVHAYGRLIAHDDPDWTRAAVSRLTARHETAYRLDQVDAEYLDRMLRAIVGIEVRLTRVEAKAKMSQNKMPDDVEGIVAGLRAAAGSGDERAEMTATWMAAHSVPAARRRQALLAEVARSHGR
jgi:transcriptional regulator